MNLASSFAAHAGGHLLSGAKLGGLGLLLVLALAAVAVAVLRGKRPEPTRPPGRTGTSRPPRTGTLPQPREIWWAEVPFEDGPGHKDRPCLVVKVNGRSATVVKITSKHHDRPAVVPLPHGMVGDRQDRQSWLETDELREVPLGDFRRRVGPVDDRIWAVARRAVG